MRIATEIEMMSALERIAAIPMALFAACRTGLVGLLLVAGSAAAQTSVSGAIAVDTHWTAANTPYVVSGDVVVQNGAVLTIDPGVAVYMAPGAGMTVQAGGIKAVGTAAQPILVLSDNTRLAQAAAPGDWKQWTFNAGTVNTRLDYVTFEHGSGLAVKGSAPIFNFLNLRNHLGAAITVDLAASPFGVGNQATGNSVNGIAVPAGDITGSVKWALRGIPYVVASGVVSVGTSPVIASVSPNVVQQGQTVTVNVTGSRLAGLARASFDAAGLTAQILAGTTDTQASLSVTADAAGIVGPATLRLLMDAGEIRLKNAVTLAQVQPTLSSLAPSTIYGGQGTVEITLNGRDFVNQTTVLVNSAAVSTQFVSTTQLRASITAPGASGNLSVRLRTPDTLNAGQYLTSNELILPVVVPQLALSPSTASIVKGAVRTFTVTMPYPAPAGGAGVSIVASVPTIATVPAGIVVPEGQTSASFELTAANLGSTVVTASRVGFASAQAQVTVVPPPVLTLSPSSLTLGVGRTAVLNVQSSVPAPGPGLTVTLASSATGVATLPASVTIAGGASTATVSVSTLTIGTATISAQAPEYLNGSAAVNVRPVSLNLPTGALVAPGLTRSIPITLSDPAPAGGLVVNLVSSNPAAATVSPSITVPAGQSNANFTLTGVAVGVATVTASADSYQSGAMPLTVDAVNISIGSPAVSSISVAEAQSLTYAVTLSRPAPAGGVVVDLATLDPSKATVAPSSVSIPAGQTSGGAVQLVVSGVLKGSTTLSGSAAGLNTATIPVTVTDKPRLQFNYASVVVGKGLKTYYYEIYVSRYTGAASYAPNEAVTVALSSSNPAKASVPATVTIPAGSASTYFYVTGADFTSGTPVTIDATATGYNAPATKLAANVVAPVFTIVNLDLNRSPASARDDFYINVSTPGSPYSTYQTAAANMPIDLSIVEANPAGIVDGFYSAVTGGAAITQTVLRQDTNSTSSAGYFHVGTPTTAGSYKVNASAAGVASVTSAVVNVTAPELKFSTTSVTVGKGLKTYFYEVYIYRAVNGASFNGVEALTVNLSSSNPAKASVPATVTIPANSASAYFYVTGVDSTSGTPAVIDATAAGYNPPATKLAANVITPVFTIAGLDFNRSPASARDDFYINVSTPGSPYSTYQTAAANMPIDLSIVGANPAGIVDGFYSAVTAGTSVTQAVLRQDTTSTSSAGYSYIASPTFAGSYKVNASAAGVASITSAVVNVAPPELRFSTTSVTVGAGMNSYYYDVYIYRAVNGAGFNGTAALTVNLSCSSTAICTVPASVTIPAGQSLVYFQVSGVAFGTTTVTATAVGYNATQDLAVKAVTPQLVLSGPGNTVVGGQSSVSVYLNVPGAANPNSQSALNAFTVNLTSSAPGVATVPATLTIPAGNTGSSAGTLRGVAPGTTTVTASGVGLSSATSGAITISP